jgi:hypothetical protein
VKPLVKEIWSTRARAVCIYIFKSKYEDPILQIFEELGAKKGDLIVYGSETLDNFKFIG